MNPCVRMFLGEPGLFAGSPLLLVSMHQGPYDGHNNADHAQ